MNSFMARPFCGSAWLRNGMIDLAPNSKTGLPLASPFILGSGAVGWGEAWPPGVEPAWFGAFVTPPLTLQARRGNPGPRLAEIPGGFILNTGDHNPGLRRVFRDDVQRWDALGPARDRRALRRRTGGLAARGRTAGRCRGGGRRSATAGGASPHEAANWIANLKRGSQLPVLVKLRAAQAAPLAEGVAGAGADALVVAAAPQAAAPAPGGQLVEGRIGGPAAFPFTLRALRAVHALELGLPIVAAGGITSESDVDWCWQMGAACVQLRSVLWTAPASVARLVTSLG